MWKSNSTGNRIVHCLAALAILLLAVHVYRGGFNLPIHHGYTKPVDSGSKTRFAILSMTTSETTYDYMSFSNKHKYAAKYGCDIIWDFEPSLQYTKVWEKLNMSRDSISASLSGEKAYEWIWMLDFDTLIANTSIRIPDVIEQSLALAEAEGKDVLDEEGKLRNEQGVLRDMLKDNIYSVADKSIITPQSIFDAYPEDLECSAGDQNTWKSGMFLLHFAGATYRLKDQKDPVGSLMRKYFGTFV